MVKRADGQGSDSDDAIDRSETADDAAAYRNTRLSRAVLPAPTLSSRQWPHAVVRVCRDPAHVRGFLQPASGVHHVVMAMSAGFRVESRELGTNRWSASEVAPGELVIAGAGAAPTELCWSSRGRGRHLDLLELYLDPSATLGSATLDGSEPGFSDPSTLDPRWMHLRDPLLGQLLLEVAKGLGSPDSAEIAFGELATTLFVAQLRRAHSGSAAPPRQLRGGLSPLALARVREYVAAHLTGAIGLGQLAGVAGLSSFHFARAFKATTGLTPHAYVLHCRTEQAKRLLANSTLPLFEIARRCGFGGPGQLSTRFRAMTGITPSAFRRSSRP